MEKGHQAKLLPLVYLSTGLRIQILRKVTILVVVNSSVAKVNRSLNSWDDLNVFDSWHINPKFRLITLDYPSRSSSLEFVHSLNYRNSFQCVWLRNLRLIFELTALI